MGMDYTAARAGRDCAGINITPDLFAEVRKIEHGALEILRNR